MPQSGDVPDIAAGSYLRLNCELTNLGDYLLLWCSDQDQAWTYEVSTGIWRKSAMTGRPSDPSNGAYNPSIVWSGHEALFWGGLWEATPDGPTGGYGYNPVTDAWRPLESANSPGGRENHAGVAIGSQMMIWGGSAPDQYGNYATTDTGGLYCMDTRSGALSSDLIASVGFVSSVIPLAGQPAKLRITVTNGGPDTSTQLHVSAPTGDDLTYQGITVPGDMTCTTPAVNNTGDIDCNGGSIKSGAAVVIEIRLSPFSTGTFQATAAATANEPDPDTGNNTATATLTVTTPNDEIFSSGFE
jgi:hypothetical protein